MLEPDTAAAVPTTPGKAACAPAGAVLLFAAGLLLAAVGVEVAAPPPPQAVAASAISPRPARAGVQRRLAADARLGVAAIMVGSHSFAVAHSLWLLIRCAARRWGRAGRRGWRGRRRRR